MNKKEIICYETDASGLVGKANKVVFPKSSEEIQKTVKDSNMDIVPRGAGSSFAGGTVPNDSLVLNMEKMNKIINFDRQTSCVYVQAGISVGELNERLNSIKMEFPAEPATPVSTIGGMIARNIFYPRNMKYGSIKNLIEEMDFVNGRGELIKISKADLKDVYGMEGITGIICSVKLKVMPKINKSISIFQTENLDELLSICRRLKQEKDTVMIEIISKNISRLLGMPKKYNLIIEFCSERGKIKGEEYSKLMNLRKNIHSSLLNIGYYEIEEYKFFFDKLKELISYLELNNILYLCYPGTGEVRMFFKNSESNKKKEALQLIKKIGGRIGNGSIGIKNKNVLEDFEKKIIQRVKLRYDPFGKFNRGKVIDFEGKFKRTFEQDIKPSAGEKISAFEIGVSKTPEEEMEGFIKKVEIIEGEIGENKTEEKPTIELDKKEESKEKLIGEKPLDETQELLRDYEYTYKSELPEERREKIEDFARDVPKQIGKRGKLTKEEEDIVKRVMMGQSVKEEKTDNQKQEGISKNETGNN